MLEIATGRAFCKTAVMHIRMAIVAGLVVGTTVGGSPVVGQGRSAAPVSIFASVGHSEWCTPPGTVRLSLATGRYAVTASPRWRTCRRPLWRQRINSGVLAADDLAAVRAAYRQARSDGLEDPPCRNGGEPRQVVLSNGGDRTLRLIERGATTLPPRNEGCWSDAASRLHRDLNDLFRPRSGR